VPDYVESQEMGCGQFFVNHQAPFEGSDNLEFTSIYRNVASANAFCLPAMLEPRMINDNQNAVDHLNLTPSIVHRLAGLDVAIYECGRKIPSSTEAGSDSTSIETRKSKLFALDDLFRLTTEFLDIFTSLARVTSKVNLSPHSTILPESTSESMLPIFTYSQHVSKAVLSPGMKESCQHFPPLDEATILMIISCHCRLTDIYVLLFEMMQACIEHSLAPRSARDWAIILPKLQVGSIASPPVYVDVNTPVSSATSSMYLLMITTLSWQLWEQLANKMRVDDRMSTIMGSRSALTEPLWDNMMDKNDHILRTINNTRCLLQQRYNTV
jgi:hypothetical protein